MSALASIADRTQAAWRRLLARSAAHGLQWLLVLVTYAFTAGTVGLYVMGCELIVPVDRSKLTGSMGGPSNSEVSVAPTAIQTGKSAQVTWAGTGTCTATEDWAGTTVTTGKTPTTSPVTAAPTTSSSGTYTYGLTCVDLMGVMYSSTDMLNVYDPPTLTLGAMTVTSGTAVPVSWSATNAKSCTTGGTNTGWTGTLLTTNANGLSQGTVTVTAPAVTSPTNWTFTLSCVENLASPGSSVSAPQQTLTINPAVTQIVPTISLTISPTQIQNDGTPAILSWNTTNAAFCFGTGDWSQTSVQLPSGTFAVSPSNPGQYSFTLSCQSAGGGTASQTVGLTVTPTPAPTIAISVTPSTIYAGGAAGSTLSWAATNSNACNASGTDPAFAGAENITGSLVVNPAITGSYTYTLTCTGVGGTTAGSTLLTVLTAPTLFPLKSPNGLALHNGSLYVANYGGGNVLIYSPDSTGKMVQQPSRTISTGLTGPVRLAFDNAGNLYVADNVNGQILVFDPSGTPIPTATITVNRPLGVAVDSTGKVYVALNGANALQVFSYPSGLAGGPLAGQTWTQDSTGLAFFAPGCLAYDAVNNLIVLCVASGSISFYTPISLSGSPTLPLVPAKPAITSGISGPTGLAFDISNDLYVTNYYTAAVTEYDFATDAQGPFALSATPSPALQNPEGIAIDKAGNGFIYVTNMPNNLIYVFNPVGVFQYALQ